MQALQRFDLCYTVGHRGAASYTHPPIRRLRDMPMPRCVLDLYSSTYPGHTHIYPSVDALLSSDNIYKSIGSCDILTTDVFGIGIRPTVGTGQAVPDGRCPKPGHAPRASIFSKQSRHFPELSFTGAVNLSIIIGKDTVDDIAHSELTLSVGRVGGMLRAGTVGCGDTRLAARQSAIRICTCAAGLHRAFPGGCAACGISRIRSSRIGRPRDVSFCINRCTGGRGFEISRAWSRRDIPYRLRLRCQSNRHPQRSPHRLHAAPHHAERRC